MDGGISQSVRVPMILTPDMLLDRIYPEQKIHTQTNGRWSTTNPPLAQLPKGLRKIVCPAPGYKWIVFDLDQVELRLNAALSNDTPSLEAFANSWDIHTLNACDLFGFAYPSNRIDPHTSDDTVEWRTVLNWEGKDDNRRVFAKRFVYRLDYGGDPARAGDIPGAKALGLTAKSLVAASRSYLLAHPAKAQWRQRVAEEARTTRTTRSWDGRRRKLSGSLDEIVREAFNHPMSAGTSGVFNRLVVTISEELPDLHWVKGMHDSQTWSVKEELYEERRGQVKAIVHRPWNIAGVSLVLPGTFSD
jgi:DNA polymerase I-like protein with 3'-5' exonuclease and polymerase domains